MMTHTLRTTLLVSAAAASLVAPGFAFAQQGVNVDEIVVTGSRIRRDTFSSPAPIAVVTGATIRESGFSSLAESLTNMPSMGGAENGQRSSGTLFLAGQARIDIRGLGASRTLVLVDGRRHVFSDASSPAVDLNLFPQLLVERVDVVPGGSSAVYGSEAIAGVVNVILRKQMEGFEADIQAGVSEEGDGEEIRAGVAYGGKFLEDRLNVVIGGEFAKVEPIMQRDRDWAYPGIRRNTLASPQTIIPASRNNTSRYATFQLRTVSTTPPPGSSVAFPNGRAVTLDNRDRTLVARLSDACSTPTVQPTCQDPSLDYSAYWSALQAKSSRGIVRGYMDYALTDNIKAFADLSVARSQGYGIFQPAFSSAVGGGTMPVTLAGDNAYLNGGGATAAALRSQWTDAGLTFTSASRAQVGKFWEEFGSRDVQAKHTTVRVVGGMEGDFNTLDRDVNWDWYAQYGETKGSTISYGQPNILRTQQATDAILVNGQAVCRDVTARAAGCVPWDLVNGASREAILWANGVSTTDQTVKETVVAGNLGFDLINLPAGPVGVAFGGEYRKEESSFAQDALGASGALYINAVGTRAGEYSVKEAYGEVRIPLLKDLPLVKELTFEAAGRLSDYSSIGNTHQYRLGLEWAPVKDVRFRASQGTAVRAPNIVELYAPQSRNFTTTAQDPCDKDVFRTATAAQQAARRVTCAAAIPGYNPATFTSNFGTGRSSLPLLQGGNPGLGAETAHTYQLGVVIQPRWIPDLQLSVDFFKYNLDEVVSTIPINTLFQNLCYDSTQAFASNEYCALIRRDATGTQGGAVVGGVIEAILTNQNVAKTKVEGYDFSAAYSFNTEDVVGSDYGRLGFRVDGTWMYRWALQGLPNQAYTQLANQVVNATPEWRVLSSVKWAFKDLSLTWSTEYIGSMASTNALGPTALAPYYTGAYYLHDLRAKYKVNDQIDLRAGILNITDETPPYLPEVFTGTASPGAAMFDNRGRYAFVGATLKY